MIRKLLLSVWYTYVGNILIIQDIYYRLIRLYTWKETNNIFKDLVIQKMFK